MSATGRQGYVVVDRRWLTDPELSDSALRLMLWLNSHTEAYLDTLHVTAIAEQMGWGRNRVQRALADLEALRLIDVEQVPDPVSGARTKITLHLSAWSERERITPRHGDAAGDARPRHGEAATPRHGDAATTSNPKGEELLPTPPAQLSLVPEPVVVVPATLDDTELFNQFWAAYPRHAGKADARKAFAKALTRAPVEAIAMGLAAMLPEWAERDPSKIPHPATWLNRDGWHDEPVQARVQLPPLTKIEQAYMRSAPGRTEAETRAWSANRRRGGRQVIEADVVDGGLR